MRGRQLQTQCMKLKLDFSLLETFLLSMCVSLRGWVVTIAPPANCPCYGDPSGISTEMPYEIREPLVCVVCKRVCVCACMCVL